MKIKLKSFLDGFEVYTVNEMLWSGVKNKNMMYQQNIEKYPVSIVVINSTSSKIEELKLFIPSFLKQIHNFEKSKVYLIEKN